LRPTFTKWKHRRHVASGKAVQEGEEVFWRDLVDRSITKFTDVTLDDCLVGSHRIFFSNESCGNRNRFWRLWKVSWPTSSVKETWNFGHAVFRGITKRYLQGRTIFTSILIKNLIYLLFELTAPRNSQLITSEQSPCPYSTPCIYVTI
jgi:hypothetical protein